jgi:hypothetical protein
MAVPPPRLARTSDTAPSNHEPGRFAAERDDHGPVGWDHRAEHRSAHAPYLQQVIIRAEPTFALARPTCCRPTRARSGNHRERDGADIQRDSPNRALAGSRACDADTVAAVASDVEMPAQEWRQRELGPLPFHPSHSMPQNRYCIDADTADEAERRRPPHLLEEFQSEPAHMNHAAPRPMNWIGRKGSPAPTTITTLDRTSQSSSRGLLLSPLIAISRTGITSRGIHSVPVRRAAARRSIR